MLSTATLVDMWYVTQTAGAVSADEFSALRRRLDQSSRMTWEPITEAIALDSNPIRRRLSDPWDRFIVATARVPEVPLGFAPWTCPRWGRAMSVTAEAGWTPGRVDYSESTLALAS